MRKRRAFVLILLAALLISASMPICGAAAQDMPTMIVDHIDAIPGETVEIAIRIEKNPGILGTTLKLEYGESLKLLSAANGDAFSMLSMTPPGRLVSGCYFNWYAESIDSSQVQDGTILKLRFLVSEDAAYGTSETITVSCQEGDMFDNALKPVSCAIQNGGISIKKQQSAVRCDSVLSAADGVHVEYQSDSVMQDVTALLASYSTNGQFRSCVAREMVLNAGKNSLVFYGTDPSLQYKVFTLRNGVPLCGAKAAVRAFTVRFNDYDGTLLSSQLVAVGADAVPPQTPGRTGYVFAGWRGTYTNVQADSVVTAQYKKDTAPALVIDSAEAAAGDANVTVRVKIRNNPGILGMTLKLSYDAAAVELVDSASGAAVRKLNYTKPGKYKNGCIFTWYAEQLSAGDVADGDILVLTFRVPDTTPAGAYPITLSFTDGDVFDRDLQTVSLKVENGNINIK